jgi:tetratricopeptide (TPR) repeat protein
VQRSIQFRGIARCELGDWGGLDDLREALRVSVERGMTREAHIGYNNYGSWLWLTRGAPDALPVYREGIDFVERRGADGSWNRAEMTWPLFDLGEWDEVVETARTLEGRVHSQPSLMASTMKAHVLFHRGRVDEARAAAPELLDRARAAGDAQVLLPALSLAALVARDRTAALAPLQELLRLESPIYPESARVCVLHGALDLAERMTATEERSPPRVRHVAATARAIVAEARGEHAEAARLYADAAERWTAYPFVLERAQCLLGLARTIDDRAAAEEARELFASLGARPLQAQAEALVRAA